MTRTDQLMALRPIVKIDTSKSSLHLEEFQNNTLRPILKFQNEIILALVNNSFGKVILPKSAIEKNLFIENYIQKNHILKNQLIGLTIALFTEFEVAIYLDHQSDINRRINQLIIKRESVIKLLKKSNSFYLINYYFFCYQSVVRFNRKKINASI